jgi:multidrug efflux system outer membrane protein
MCLFFLFILSMALFGQEGEPLVITLEEAVRMALDTSLDLQKSRLDLSDAEYSSKHLWAQVFPSLSAGGGINYGTGLFVDPGFKADAANFGYSLSAGISLGLNAGIPYRMKGIRLAYEGALLSYDDACRQLEIQVAKAFYTLIAERENVSHKQDALNLAERQLEKTGISYENGFTGELSLLNSRLAVEVARSDLSGARSSVQQNLASFLDLIGLERQTVHLEGEIEVSPVKADSEFLIARYLSGRPDIAEKRLALESAENTRKQGSIGDRAPSLRLAADWGGRGSGGEDDKFSDSVSGSVSLSIPINPWIPGTTENQTLRKAGAAVEKARLDLKSAETSAAQEIRTLTMMLESSLEALEINRLRLEIARRNYELSEQGFQNGTVESLSLEDARKSLNEARYSLLQSELSCLTTVLDLATAVNMDWRELMKSKNGAAEVRPGSEE